MMPTRYLRSTLHRQPALLSLHFVALDHSVLNMDHSVGVGGDVVFVGDEDDGIAFGMKAIEQGHDFVTGLRVQVSGGLVGKNYGWTIHKCTRNRDSLPLTTGELIRLVAHAGFHTHG